MKSVFLLVDIGFTGYDNLNSSKAETPLRLSGD